MAHSGFIRDTTKAIHRLLQAGVQISSDRPLQILTGAPDRTQIARSLPCLSVYLYRIEERGDLYRPEKIVEGRSGKSTLRYRDPPIYMTLRFAVLFWGRTPDEEHRLIGAALGVLLETPHLEEGQGFEAESFQSGERISLKLTSPFELSDQNEILASLGLSLRPVLACSATARLDSKRIATIRTVSHRVARVNELES
ncbi:MAG: Pvc16 family protein [Planctomycetota bacterium]|nr:Pvc16 family protein [Planctomycetota bacterium]